MKLEVNQEQKTWTSAAQSIYAVLQYTDQLDLSLAEVMGYTAHAFRINIHPQTVSPAGPTMFDPYDLVALAMYTLGIESITVNKETPLPPETIGRYIKMIQHGVDNGFPVIGWDLFIPEFGLIYGYDHEKQVLFAKDVEKDGKIPYNKFGERQHNHVYFSLITDIRPKHMVHMLKEGLRTSIQHAHGKSPWASKEYKHGLAGYAAWLEAFEAHSIDPFGNAYNAEVVADARKFAYQFFHQLAQKWPTDSALDLKVIDLLKQAEETYKDIAAALAQLRELFPFPQGGDPEDPQSRSKAVKYLKKAYEAEQHGVKLQEKLYKCIQDYEIDESMTCRTIRKKFQTVGEQHHAFLENVDRELTMALKQIRKRVHEITSAISVETIVYGSQIEEDKQVNYIVGYKVLPSMDILPNGMVYSCIENEFANIKGKEEQRDEMIERLRAWIVEQGYEEDRAAQSVEEISMHGNNRMLDIYLPIKK